jgi:hypothetical protein
MYLHKIINTSSAFLISAFHIASAMETDEALKKDSSLTAQIRAKVDQILEKFYLDMDEYYRRTRSKKRISSTSTTTTVKKFESPRKATRKPNPDNFPQEPGKMNIFFKGSCVGTSDEYCGIFTPIPAYSQQFTEQVESSNQLLDRTGKYFSMTRKGGGDKVYYELSQNSTLPLSTDAYTQWLETQKIEVGKLKSEQQQQQQQYQQKQQLGQQLQQEIQLQAPQIQEDIKAVEQAYQLARARIQKLTSYLETSPGVPTAQQNLQEKQQAANYLEWAWGDLNNRLKYQRQNLQNLLHNPHAFTIQQLQHELQNLTQNQSMRHALHAYLQSLQNEQRELAQQQERGHTP